MLVLGILMMGLFLYDQSEKSEGSFSFFERDIFQLTHCSAVEEQVSIKTNGGKNSDRFELDCDSNNLSVKEVFSVPEGLSGEELKRALYKRLANSLKLIAELSEKDSLERVLIIRYELEAPSKLTVSAITEGKYLSKLGTLQRPDFIAKHLQATVQVSEQMP